MKIDDFYPQGFPPCYLPQTLTYYKVPIQRCSEFVYMKPNDQYTDSHSPVIIAKDLFLFIWSDAPRFDDPPFVAGIPYAKTPEIWKQDRKLQDGYVKKCFSYGIDNPVPVSVVDRVVGNKLFLLDGITRILYLLINNVEAFPVMCPNEYVAMLTNLASPTPR